MTAFVRERSDADWYRGLKIPASVLLNIDEKTKKAISGTGGTWTPSAAIILGGAGLELQCGMQLSGGATVYPGVGKNYKFGDDDYFTFAAPVSRVIDESPMSVRAMSFPREMKPVGSTVTSAHCFQMRRLGARARFPLKIPDGARLNTARVVFRVAIAHANVPDYLPKARVVRITAAGVVSKYPHQSNATAEPDGWVRFARPATGADWYAAGAQQNLDITFDSSDSTTVSRADTSLYSYALEWWDEHGTNAFTADDGSLIDHLVLTVVSPDLRPY